MKKLMSLLLAGLLLVTTAATAAAPYANNRAPLREKPFVKLPLGAIRAEGWLRDQLQRQADATAGWAATATSGNAAPTGSTGCCRWPISSATNG